jgi:hypothetical protein
VLLYHLYFSHFCVHGLSLNVRWVLKHLLVFLKYLLKPKPQVRALARNKAKHADVADVCDRLRDNLAGAPSVSGKAAEYLSTFSTFLNEASFYVWKVFRNLSLPSIMKWLVKGPGCPSRHAMLLKGPGYTSRHARLLKGPGYPSRHVT